MLHGNSSPAGEPRRAGPTGRYRFSAGFSLRWLASAALRRRRDLVADGRREIARHAPPARLEGGERLPALGPFILVVNHYERVGMRMWWIGWYASVLISERTSGPTIRWFAAGQFRGWRPFGVTMVPAVAVRWFLRRVGHAYDFILVDPSDPRARGRALREAHRTLHRDRRPVGIAPEAGNAPGLSRQLIRGVAESGAAIGWLSRGLVPVVPMALWEDCDGRVVARVGEPYTLEQPPADLRGRAQPELTDRIMRSVAALLPEELRGAYRDGTG